MPIDMGGELYRVCRTWLGKWSEGDLVARDMLGPDFARHLETGAVEPYSPAAFESVADRLDTETALRAEAAEASAKQFQQELHAERKAHDETAAERDRLALERDQLKEQLAQAQAQAQAQAKARRKGSGDE